MNTLIMILSSVLVVWLMCAVAVKQIGYILMHGSIFESLRGWVNTGMREGWFGFRKLNELFTCKVCMTTQVSLWFVAVPLVLSGLIPNDNRVVYIFIPVLVTFATSGLAVLFWNLSEYKVIKFEEERENCLKNIRQLKREILKGNGSGTLVGIEYGLDRDQFDDILDLIEEECDGIGCGYSRKDCREETLSKLLLNLSKKKPEKYSDAIKVLGYALGIVVPEYFRGLSRRHDRSEKKLERDRAFKHLQEIMK